MSQVVLLKFGNLGPVVQSTVSLAKLLVKDLLSLTVLRQSVVVVFFIEKM